MTARVGVDVGGTFTDVVAVVDGEVCVHKTPSTPDEPEDGVVEGLTEAADAHGFAPGDVDFLGHGTTVATNAVLEREWADTALVTTAGVRDVLAIGRGDRPDIYDLDAATPEPVVPRDRRHEVPERLDERGAVLTELEEDAVREVARQIGDVESVAVCLLFAFEDDAHERRVAEILRAELDVPVSLSSRVRPEIREYERTTTTALNAALRPVMDDYLGALEAEVGSLGVDADLAVMQSNGGVTTAGDARERPVTTLLSGPAAGVTGAAHLGARCGVPDLVTMDMGGTSCDVSLVEGGEPAITTETAVGDYPVGVPAVDVHAVGAGGGSVAWLDDGGALRVGPRSAGADPGPVCYGRGGERPTVTDAHLALGRLSTDTLLPPDPADRGTVEAAIERELADPLGVSVPEAAAGVIEVANANMARALRVVTVERGHDPREFALLAFGGAGPLHAGALAADLGVPRVLVPPAAGTLSALGLLAGDLVADESVSRVRDLAAVEPAALAATFADLAASARDRLPAEEPTVERAVDLRYVGQSFELRVPAPDDLDAAAIEELAGRFHERHERRYGHAEPDEPVELVTVRVRARAPVEAPPLGRPGGDTLADARRETRPVRFEGQVRETPVYDRGRLPAGATLDGPAVLEGAESTVVVEPGHHADVDADGILHVEVAE
jgi:N-methylhydantoinase A